MATGIHRSSAGTRSARQMIRIGKEPSVELSQEVKDWNAAVEAKKLAKKAKSVQTVAPEGKTS